MQKNTAEKILVDKHKLIRIKEIVETQTCWSFGKENVSEMRKAFRQIAGIIKVILEE